MQVDILKKNLIFDDSDNENKGLLKKYTHVWDGIKNEIKTINGGKEIDYGKDYTKIKFNSNDDLPLNKSLKFHAMVRIIRSVFEEDGKFYPQLYLDNCSMSCKKTLELIFQKELMLIKRAHQKNVIFVIIGFKYEPYLCKKLLFMLKDMLTEFILGIRVKMMQLT